MKKVLCMVLLLACAASSFCFNVQAADSGRWPKERQQLKRAVFALKSVNPYGPYDFADDRYSEISTEAKAILNDAELAEETYYNEYVKVNDFVMSERYISYDYARDTCNNAMVMTNDDLWYTDEEWSLFVEKREALNAALNNCDLGNAQPGFVRLEINDARTVTDAFHALLKSYNLMTNRDAIAGDINGDKIVNVNDITLLQRYLAGEESLNGAQKMRAAVFGFRNVEGVSINDATRLQRYLADFITSPANEPEYYSVFVSEVKLNQFTTADFMMERLFNYTLCPIRTEYGKGIMMPVGYYSPLDFFQNSHL